MRTTLDLNENLIAQARKMTNIQEKTALIHEALRVLISQAAQKELVAFAGTQKKMKSPPRRKVG
ncbi:MAG: type II toxin-antitoxin system VapB family antitoxin [Pseudobdellovibrionaceae bacterium]